MGNLNFIIVYDKETEEAAYSLYNRAAEMKICATMWSEKEFEANRVKLSNSNKFLFLSSNLSQKALMDVQDPVDLGYKVYMKRAGNCVGIFLDDDVDYLEIYNKERKKIENNIAVRLIKWVYPVPTTFIIGLISKKKAEKKARKRVLLSGMSTFANKYLDDFLKE